MEEFLEQEDRKEERKHNKKEDDEDENEIDLFDDVGDEADTGAMYAQYFNDEEGAEEMNGVDEGGFGEDQGGGGDSSEEEEEEEGDPDEEEKVKVNKPTTFLGNDTSVTVWDPVHYDQDSDSGVGFNNSGFGSNLT